MKLTFVLEDLLTGGAQTHAVDLALRLRRRGMTVQVLVLGAQVSAALAARLEGGLTMLDQAGLTRGAEWRRLGRAIAATRADLVLAVNPVAVSVSAAARAFGLRSPVAAVFHSTAVQGRAGWLRTAPFIAAARTCEALVYVSQRQHAHWRRRGLGARRVLVIRNGVDLQHHVRVETWNRAQAKAALGLDPAALTLGSVAMFRREKNHAQMIDALAGLHARGVPAELLLVGDGPTRPAVEAQVRAAGLQAWVRFCGEQAEVRPFLAAMDVGVLTSTAVETLPLFGLELMASGAPLVASDVGGLSDLVEDGLDGLLFPPRNTPFLINQLARCADPAVRDRLAAAAARKAQSFCADAMADRYAALANDLVAA